MKKLLLLPIIFGLAACDSGPNVSVNMICAMDKNIAMDIYDNYAIMSVDGGEEIRLDKKIETVGAKSVDINLVGGDWSFYLKLDREQSALRRVSVVPPKYDGIWVCEVLVPFKSEYGRATDVEWCIEFISENVFLNSGYTDDKRPVWFLNIEVPQTIHLENGGIRHYVELVHVSVADAIALSPNWDYSGAVREYDLTDGVQVWEQDACDVKERLEQYIKKLGIPSDINPDGTSFEK